MVLIKAFYIFIVTEKGGRKSNGEERIDLPLGDDIDSAISRRKAEDKEPTSVKSYKAKSNSKSSGKPRKK